VGKGAYPEANLIYVLLLKKYIMKIMSKFPKQHVVGCREN